MARARRTLGRSRGARCVAIALTIAAMGLVACGDDDGDAPTTTEPPAVETDSAVSPEASGEEILILTQVTFVEGEPGATAEILDGSTIGGSPFCPGGTAEDRHGTEDPTEEPYGLVDRTITCSDGTLRMGFSPQTPVGNTQSGPWTIVSGTGAYEGWQGSGKMEAKYDRDDDTKARERYTGTVTH